MDEVPGLPYSRTVDGVHISLHVGVDGPKGMVPLVRRGTGSSRHMTDRKQQPEDGDEHDLKGVPERWRLYRAVA
jgi:hypothetical protein